MYDVALEKNISKSPLPEFFIMNVMVFKKLKAISLKVYLYTEIISLKSDYLQQFLL